MNPSVIDWHRYKNNVLDTLVLSEREHLAKNNSATERLR